MADDKVKQLAGYIRSSYNLPLYASDEDILRYAHQQDPEGYLDAQNRVLNPASMPAQHPIVDAFNKGFMGQPIANQNPSIPEDVAHFAGESGLPMVGAIGGSIAGPAGTVAGTMAGAAVQKAAQSLLSSVAPNAYGENNNADNPIGTANDVLKQGALQGLFEGGTLAGKALISKIGEGLPGFLSATTKIPKGDIETAIARPGDIFSDKTPQEIQQIYREGITPNSQELLPGFQGMAEQNQPLKHFMQDYADKAGTDLGMLKKADEASVAQDAADTAMKAIRNGGKVVMPTGESRLLTPQEAFSGIQGMNYFRFNKEAATGKFANKINQQAYDDLIGYLEKNGYPAIRDSLLTWNEGSIAKKFASAIPMTAKGKPDMVRLTELGLLGTDAVMGHSTARMAAEVPLMLAQSPWLVGKAIKYGVPAVNTLGPLMSKATTPTNAILAQLMANATKDDENK